MSRGGGGGETYGNITEPYDGPGKFYSETTKSSEPPLPTHAINNVRSISVCKCKSLIREMSFEATL